MCIFGDIQAEEIYILREFSRKIMRPESQKDELMRQFDVTITHQFEDKDNDNIIVTGKPSCVADAIAHLKAKVHELETAKQEQVRPHMSFIQCEGTHDSVAI